MSRCPFVPGQKYFLVPVSLCPRTRAGAKIPGQTPLSLDAQGQNYFPPKKQKTGKGRSKTGKGHSETGKDVLKQEIIGKNSDCPGPSRVPSRILIGCPGSSRGKILQLLIGDSNMLDFQHLSN